MIKADIQHLQPWKEALTQLSENHFLDLVRMYVGVIKTPYNKERLINELVAFLHREENRQALLALLSETDKVILSALTFITNADRQKLTSFFSGQFSDVALYECLMNLEERLIIFRLIDEQTGKQFFAVNPLLKENLLPHLNISLLFPLPQKTNSEHSNTNTDNEKATKKTTLQGKTSLSARLLASWFAFIAENPDACRADGSFKKKTLEQINEMFHGISVDFLLKLNTSLVNLTLFMQDGINLVPNVGKWQSFSNLPSKVQYAYIAVAFGTRVPRDILVKHASFADIVISSIPKEGYTLPILLRLVFFLQEKQNTPITQRTGYFAQILHKANNNPNDDQAFSSETLIESMLAFGLLSVSEKDENIVVCPENEAYSGQTVENTDKTQDENFSSPKENIAGSISIDAGFSITLLRELPLANLLDLVQCMELTNFDTVCLFTITRQACMRCFDRGINMQDIFHVLEKTAGYALPQNLSFSLDEWSNAYNSASLFKGYVLQVSPDKQVQIENNPIIAPYIKMTLVPGIYLLDFAGEEEAIASIQKSGLNFIGMPKKLHAEQEVLPFTDFLQSSPLGLIYDRAKQDKDNYTEKVKNLQDDKTEAHLKKMKDDVEKLDLSPGQKEGLLLRIERKIILATTQLRGDSVRVEKTEASGMDFVGKVYVLEQAIAASNMIEISTGANVYFGLPTKLEKRAGDASLTMTLENEQETIKLSIGQARTIKRFRGSLFSERL